MSLHNPLEIIAIIPARFASTRFPGKPLVDIKGKPMIQWVYEQVQKVSAISKVVVATDDLRIESVVKNFGGNVVLTDPLHPSGTDRCWEAYQKLQSTADFIINVQGDEPFIQPEQIELLLQQLNQEVELATLIKKIEDTQLLINPNIVKAVINLKQQALYFSRHPIPFIRGTETSQWLAQHTYYKHIGMYAYRKDVLEKITQLKPSPLEQCESLEQLRWLENGYSIQTTLTPIETIGIDSPEDLDRLLQSIDTL
jgi:3-deoxy-manno-octulosonate cytidylyltransferase (CMP-KDO synthetase)